MKRNTLIGYSYYKIKNDNNEQRIEYSELLEIAKCNTCEAGKADVIKNLEALGLEDLNKLSKLINEAINNLENKDE